MPRKFLLKVRSVFGPALDRVTQKVSELSGLKCEQRDGWYVFEVPSKRDASALRRAVEVALAGEISRAVGLEYPWLLAWPFRRRLVEARVEEA